MLYTRKLFACFLLFTLVVCLQAYDDKENVIDTDEFDEAKVEEVDEEEDTNLPEFPEEVNETFEKILKQLEEQDADWLKG